MEPIRKGKQTNKTSNMCTSDKGKQTNKQAEVACAEAWMQGAVQSCITCGVQYAMRQSMQKSFEDALEMCQKSAEFDMQGHTLTEAYGSQCCSIYIGMIRDACSCNRVLLMPFSRKYCPLKMTTGGTLLP